MQFRFPILVTVLFLLSNCQQLPEKKLNQFAMKIEREVANDSLRVEIVNPVACPLRISVSSENDTLQADIDKTFPLTLAPNADTIISYWTDKKIKEELPMRYSITMGNPKDTIYLQDINLPFPSARSYKIIQGYNGTYSHTSEYSKYALDFNMQIGDTVCAAAGGYVVGVIEGYSKSGTSMKWRDYANYITLFHPEMNLYTQYVHLAENGSFVAVGDTVIAEQVIGLSGKTGFTDMEHLHFNVLKPNEKGMESVQIEFKEGYKGIDLKKGDLVKKEK